MKKFLLNGRLLSFIHFLYEIHEHTKLMTTSYFGLSGLRKDQTANIQALISTSPQYPAGRVHFDALGT
jgi:hypothetical protein